MEKIWFYLAFLKLSSRGYWIESLRSWTSSLLRKKRNLLSSSRWVFVFLPVVHIQYTQRIKRITTEICSGLQMDLCILKFCCRVQLSISMKLFSCSFIVFRFIMNFCVFTIKLWAWLLLLLCISWCNLRLRALQWNGVTYVFMLQFEKCCGLWLHRIFSWSMYMMQCGCVALQEPSD